MTIVGCSVRHFCFFKLTLGDEELCSSQLVVADRRNENHVQPTNVVNSQCRACVSRAGDGRGVEWKTKSTIELFPALD